jgi:hypothetical protein
MMTVDVRLLVRGNREIDEVLRQLLSGVLRVHAAVQLLTLPSGLVAPDVTVYRLPRSVQHYATVRAWSGELR